jgi:arylsulfatase
MGAFRDTVIFFLSDNGASAELIIRADGHDPRAEPGSARTHLCLGPGWSTASNTPFRLHKSWVHEGGIASPWIVHWPAGIRDAGALRHDCCHFIDVPVTLLELAGGDPHRPPAEGAPRFSGISIAPAFARDGILRREFLYFNHNNNRALRVGDWKLVAAGADGPWELYDLARDRAEQDNLIARFPERAEKLAARWKQLDEEFARQRETSPPASSELLMKAGA